MEWIGWGAAALLAVILVVIWQKGAQRQQADASALEALRAQLKQKDEDLKELRASAARQLRSAQEEAQHAPGKLGKALLPVDDALQKALGQDVDAESWRDGAVLVVRQLEAALASVSITPLDAAPEQAFDPHLHECIAELPGQAQGELVLVEVSRRGWMQHERLLRPAEVVVTRVPAPEPEPTTEPEQGEPAQEALAQEPVEEAVEAAVEAAVEEPATVAG